MSIHYRPYLEHVDGKPLLSHLFARIRQMAGFCDQLVAGVRNAASDSEELIQTCRELGIHAIPAARAMRELYESIGHYRHVLFCQAGVALLPRRCLHRAASFLKTQDLDLVVLDRTPTGCRFVLASSKLLQLIGSLRIPSLPLDPIEALGHWAGVCRTIAPEAGAQYARRVAFLSLREEYGGAEAELPLSVGFMDKQDLVTARALLEGEGDSVADDLTVLQRWKKLQVEQTEARLLRPRLFPHCPDQRTRVTFVSLPSTYSGAEDALVRLVAAIGQEGVSPSALIGAEGLLSERLRASGCDVSVWNSDFGAATPANAADLYDLLNRWKPDLIHVNSPSGVLIPSLALALGVPLVYHARLPDYIGVGAEVAASSAVICVSEFVRQRVLAVPISQSRAHVIYDGTDVDWFSPSCYSQVTARRALGVPASALVILVIARFSSNKRHDLAVEAFARVASSTPNTILILVGESSSDGTVRTDVEILVRELGLSGRVRFLGFQADTRVAIAASDLLILCSENEPLGMAVLEAMAMAKPVIVGRNGGTHELVRDGETGFILREQSPAVLAQVTQELLQDPKLRVVVGSKARHDIEKRFNQSGVARTVAEVYMQVLGRA